MFIRRSTLAPTPELESGDAESCCTPPGHDVPEEVVGEDVRVLSGMANDTRYELLRILSATDGEVCACDLPPAVGLSQSAVSHALSRLHEAGLVARRKDGRWRYYDVTPTAEHLLDALDAIREDRDD